MQYFRLPSSLNQWSTALRTAPFWRLEAQQLVPSQAGFSTAWIVLFGKALTADALADVAKLVGEHQLQGNVYPLQMIADTPLLVIGCDGFAAPLAEALNNRYQGLDVCHLAHLPTLSEPGLLVMDMDSTAICIECIDEIAKLAGVGEQVSAVTAAAMQGQLPFNESLQRRVALLAGAPSAILSQVAQDLPWMPQLQFMVDRLKAANWKIAIASGGFSYFAQILQQALGLDAIYANQLEVVDGLLTGNVSGAIIDGAAKAQALQQLAALHDIRHEQTVAIGDGANDLPMMAVAGLGIAIHAKPIVRQQAQASLVHHNLAGVIALLSAKACSTRCWDRLSEPSS